MLHTGNDVGNKGAGGTVGKLSRLKVAGYKLKVTTNTFCEKREFKEPRISIRR